VSGSETKSGLTIAQVLSWLNYGGVESYAIRLARAMRDRGHRVIVVSSGGQLVPELEASGIQHFQADFTGGRMLAGLGRLRRLLGREQVDLLNAHNWRAGMVSYLACRMAGVPYVLTVHGTRRPLHRYGMFYWSKKVVVVSDASRRNLIEGFGLPAARVVRSMIGVDCERFRPQERHARFEEELGLQAGVPRVLHVSRFSRSKWPVALALIEGMDVLNTRVPGVELVLAGQGPQERAVASAAQAANKRLGRKAVFFLGGRDDVPRLLSLADVVVGTASVGLEAMASGKPLVAAGKGGHFGIVRPANVERAEETCFGDHEEVGRIAARRLEADVEELLRDREEALSLGQFGRRRAVSHHDISQVAARVESIYRGILLDRKQVHRILVFHLNQIGDLLFTLPALKVLRGAFPNAHITSILRPHLAGMVRESGFVDEIAHRPVGGPWGAVALGIRLRREKPDLAVAFSQSATMALCARLSGARQRVGYVDSDFARALNHRIQVRGIPCPDKVMRLVRGLGLDAQDARYVGLLRISQEDDKEGERLASGCELTGSGPLVALAPGEAADRAYKSWSIGGFREVAGILAREDGARLIVVGGEADRALGDRVIGEMDGRACNLAGQTTPAQLAAVLARCSLLVGIDSGPMHVAAAMGTPVVALFGPTDPSRTGPQGEGHEVIFHRQPCWRPCVHPVVPSCRERLCMSAITVEEVVAAARRILSSSSAPRAAGA
jgi:ADP-heptose:LPS heptosyltransferase/glycosyltransferase involved in cell wall biosynthesis